MTDKAVAAAEKIAAMQTEEFFLTCRGSADREAFRRETSRSVRTLVSETRT
jgi:hypothetical protein